MTLFELIAIAGTAELLALVWILTALAWPRATGLGDLGLRGVRGPARNLPVGRSVTRHPWTGPPFAAPRPVGESAPGG